MSDQNKHRVGGALYVKVKGERLKAKGSFTCNPGKSKREAVMGPDGVHGYSEMPQVPFLEGAITADRDTDIEALLDITDETATVELANGQTFVLSHAWHAGEGSLTTEEGELGIRFEGTHGEFVK